MIKEKGCNVVKSILRGSGFCSSSRQLLTASLFTASLLAGCGTPAQQFVQGQRPNLNAASAQRTRGDWFASLRPDLQQYYAPARGKTGRELFAVLSQIISQGQTPVEYQEAKSFLYASADNTVVNNRPGLFDCYSWIDIAGTGGDGGQYKEQGDSNADGTPGDFINAEHTWPQSFFNKVMPMVGDMHHIFPSLSKPNAMRSNYPIGQVEGTVVYSTSGGAKLSAFDKTGRHSPAETTKLFNLPWEQQPHQVLDQDFKVTFEPPDRQKGNTARALLYFYLRYNKESIRNGAFNEQEFWDSKVPTYLQWIKQDAPDELENRRHEMIAQRQHNRNPFLDIPDLGDLIGADTLIQTPPGANRMIQAPGFISERPD